MLIEDITHQAERPLDAHVGEHHAERYNIEDDEFHDAAESEDSFEDATEHFDANTLPPASSFIGAAATTAAEASPDACSSAQQAASSDRAGEEAAMPDAQSVRLLPPRAALDGQAAAQQSREGAGDAGPNSADDGPASADKKTAPQSDAAAADAAPTAALSREEQQRRTEEAEALKKQGNELFGAGNYTEAQAKYSEVLDMAPPDAPQRAVYFANRAAAALKLKEWSNAAADCTAAIGIDAAYVKAYMRRAVAYEESDDLERSLSDLKKVVELDPGNTQASRKVVQMEPILNERREKMKEEMIGKLKDLGNTVLGKFGMSLDNFQAVKDPNTGSYSINFKQ